MKFTISMNTVFIGVAFIAFLIVGSPFDFSSFVTVYAKILGWIFLIMSILSLTISTLVKTKGVKFKEKDFNEKDISTLKNIYSAIFNRVGVKLVLSSVLMFFVAYSTFDIYFASLSFAFIFVALLLKDKIITNYVNEAKTLFGK